MDKFDNDASNYDKAIETVYRALSDASKVEFEQYKGESKLLADLLFKHLRFIQTNETFTSYLSYLQKQSPTTFRKQFNMLHNHIIGNVTNNTIRALSRFIAWCFIENVWRKNEIGDGTEKNLAKYYLGISQNINEEEATSRIFTISSLYHDLIIDDIKTSVVDGLDRIDSVDKELTKKISNLNALYDDAQARVIEGEEKLSRYSKQLDENKVEYAFVLLAQSFNRFFLRKSSERKYLFTGLSCVSVSIILIPLLAMSSFPSHTDNSSITLVATEIESVATTSASPQGTAGDKFPLDGNGEIQDLMTASKPISMSGELGSSMMKILPILGLELILIYFFRVLLHQYNAVQAQLIQIELKMSAIGFIQEYVTFKDEHNSINLEKFESLIFGGIVADLNDIPSTFDGVEQIIKALKPQ